MASPRMIICSVLATTPIVLLVILFQLDIAQFPSLLRIVRSRQPTDNIRMTNDWLVIALSPNELTSWKCSSIAHHLPRTRVLSYHDKQVYKLRHLSVDGTPCEFRLVTNPAPRHQKITEGRAKAFIHAMENGARRIRTCTEWNPYEHRKQTTSMFKYNGTKSYQILRKYFSCAIQNRTVDTMLNASLLNKADALIAKALLFGQETFSKSLRCPQGTGFPMLQVQDNANNFIGIDFANGIFGQSAFWLLPVVDLTPCESWAWSQVIAQFLNRHEQLLYFSDAEFRFTSTNLTQCAKMNPWRITIRNETEVSLLGHDNIVSIMKMLNTMFMGHAITTEKFSQLSQWAHLVDKINMGNVSQATPLIEVMNAKAIARLYNKTCSRSVAKVDITQPWGQFSRLVLLVVFNRDNITWLPYIEMVYRPFFPNIIYCLPSYAAKTTGAKLSNDSVWNVTIVYFEATRREFTASTFYMCIPAVQRLNLKADGYLVLGDDTLYSVHALHRLPKGRSAIMHRLPASCNHLSPTHMACNKWSHFKQAGKALWALQQEATALNPEDLIAKCFKRIRSITGFKFAVPYDSADIFYFPAELLRNASTVFKMLYRKRVFVEVATVYVLACLSDELPTPLKGASSFIADRNEFHKYGLPFKRGDIDSYHPAKMSYVMKGEKKYVNSLCNDYIPFLHLVY